MTYSALYRTYRSQTFEDVLGQGHITETLQSAIREGRVSHAYLFSGTRGTGKTSTARILAKALNCEKGPTPEPCNKCDTCRAITDGTSLDVIEIDAASHGGVDDVRELRDNAVLAPAIARKKVYIVDEAHMVSAAGWNAFLKTVEEPPDHVVFVFATTEPHKVLPTILSRCQRFDFRRISSSVIAEHLARICKEEGVDADDGALQLIARAAEGGMRDALSTLDQLASAGSVSMGDAARLLGSGTSDTLFEFADALAASDTASAVRLVARLVEEGQDLRMFARSLVDHVRALLFSKQIPDPGELIDANDETRAQYATQAERFSGARLVHILKLFVDALTEMRQQAAPRLTVELAVVRATMPEVDDSATAAIARIERLERIFEGGVPEREPATKTSPAIAKAPPGEAPAAEAAPSVVREKAPAKKVVAKASTKKEAVAEEPVATAASTTNLTLEKIRGSWPLVLEEIRKNSKKLHALIGTVSPHSFEGETIRFDVLSSWHAEQLAEPKNARVISQALTAVFGSAPRITPNVVEKKNEPEEMDSSRAAEPAGDVMDILKAGFGDVVVEE